MIKDFQKKHGLTPDGKIGRQTALKIKEVFKLTNEQTAHFLGQCSVESGNFTRTRESMNYSVSGLKSTFEYYKKRPEEAKIDGRKYIEKSLSTARQETIANKVYWDKNRSANYKLGNPNWGDGWKNRGTGPTQLTGGANIGAFADHVKDPRIKENPDLIWQEYYFEAAIFYYKSKRIFEVATKVNQITSNAVTRMVQGGNLHAAKRFSETNKFYKMLIK